MVSVRILCVLAKTALLLLSFGLQAYEMPIGVPVPTFGQALANPITSPLPANPSGWPGQEVPGYYYIDNTVSNATDTGNSYGFPGKPRKTIPSALEAGAVVEIHGGPYVYGGDFQLTMNGTSSAPVYVYGVDSPEITAGRSLINGSYFIVDGLHLAANRIVMSNAHYATIRNTDVAGPSQQNGAALGGDHIVFYNNDVHHHQADDKHGVTITQGSRYVWILNNQLHHNGGDGIQFCHGCSTTPPEYIYVAGNLAYGNRENGIDLKYGSNIILSQNRVYHHQPSQVGVEFCYDDNSGCTVGSSGSDGASIVVGSDGAPSNVWVIFNEVYDSGKGIRVEEAYDGVLLGNVIHDVDAIGIEFEKSGEGPNTVAFNTVNHASTGIKGPWQGGSLVLNIENNIVSDISGISLQIDENYADSTASRNLFYNNGGSVTVKWQSTTKDLSTGEAIDLMVTGSGNLIGDPRFRNVASDDYSIVSGGAGIDRASDLLLTLNQRYQSIFGGELNIVRDFAGTPRSPGGSNHDIGAYELSDGIIKAPPSPPVLYTP